MLETGIKIIEWPSLEYCTMSAFGGDACQRKAMSHKLSFIIIDKRTSSSVRLCLFLCISFSSFSSIYLPISNTKDLKLPLSNNLAKHLSIYLFIFLFIYLYRFGCFLYSLFFETQYLCNNYKELIRQMALLEHIIDAK